MAHVLIMVSVEVRDPEITPDTGTEIQTILETGVQNNWHLLQELGAQAYHLTFEGIV